MPYIDQINTNLLQKKMDSNEVIQTRRLKTISQVFTVSSSNTFKITKFIIFNPLVFLNGIKLLDTEFSVNSESNEITVPTVNSNDVLEVYQTLDKADSLEYFPLYYEEEINSSKTIFVLPWLYDSYFNTITIYVNGNLVNRSEYVCRSDDTVEFNSPLNVGDKVVFFSSLPSTLSDLYGEYFNTFPILGTINYAGDTPPPGFVLLNGQIVNRSEYPTAWILISPQAISDNDWNSSIDNQTLFSSGDGVRTFRLPKYEQESGSIKCIKLFNAVQNKAVLNVTGIQNSLNSLITQFDNRPFTRNLIVNGSCVINTRGTDIENTGVAYSLDRWLIWRNLVPATVTQGTNLLSSTNSRKTIRIETNIGSDNESGIALQHRIENIYRFSEKTFTLSFRAKSDSLNPIALEIYYNFGQDGYPQIREAFKNIFSINKDWNRYAFTFSVPKLTQYNIDNTSGFLGISFWLSAGLDISMASGIGQRDSVYELTDFQLEEGSFMTGIENIPDSLQRSLCDYYCRRYKTQKDIEELSWYMRVPPIEVVVPSGYIYDSEIYISEDEVGV